MSGADTPLEADVVVVGGGLTGLLTARGLLRRGLSVTVIEASNQLGGHIRPLPADLTGPFSGSPAASPSHARRGARLWQIDNSRFVKGQHELLQEELRQCGLHSCRRSQPPHLYVQSFHLPPMRWESYIAQVKALPEYLPAVHIIDQDAARLDLTQGFLQLSADHLDVPFSQYVQNNLGLTNPVLLEFFVSLPLHLLDGHAQDVSALMVLHSVASFRGFQHALAHILVHDCIEEGLPALVERVATQCRELGGRLNVATPAISLRYEHRTRPPVRTPNYEYVSCDLPLVTCHVGVADGHVIRCRAVVLATPLNSLPSLRCTPPLPPALLRASERCSNSQHYAEAYAVATQVSTRVPALLLLSRESTPQRALVLAREPHGGGRCLISVAGRRDGILRDACMALRAAYPAAQLCGDPFLRDDARDCWLRGARFLLRPGTARLHRDAWEDCRVLWTSSLCVLVACAELSPSWPGWAESCASAAVEATQTLLPHLIPPKIARNFAQAVPC